jgi:hypothetical protein
MMWTDVVVDRIVSEEDVQRVWAGVFGLPVEAVAITPDWGEDDRWDRPGVRVAVARYEEPDHEFPMILSMVLLDESLAVAVSGDARTLDAIQRFCASLNCRAITAVSADDETSWTLITPSERWRIRGFEPAQAGEHLANATFEPLAVVAA